MTVDNKITRRNIIKTGVASLVSAAIITPDGHAAYPDDIKSKKKGETKVVFLGGDYLHNFSAQERGIRSVCEKAGWKCYSLHDARYATPGLIQDADLMMIQRWVGGVPGWVPGPVREESPTNDGYISDELEAAIIDNVSNRGMGFMSLHCTVASWGSESFMDFLGVYGIIHGPLQTVRLHNFNQDHPISSGMTEFIIPIDENFGAELTDPGAIPLYETTGLSDKRHDIAGWCLDRDKGRIVGLTAGHTYFAYQDPKYLKLIWRGAHWALKREIPPYEG
ncbi:ThuA domain-containing protein [Candidatus Latescibacterota bacterium]